MAVAARATQSVVIVLADKAQTGPRVTQSLVLAVAWPPCPARVTQSALLVLADKAQTGPRVTQSAVVILCNEREVPDPTLRIRVTQSLVLAVVDPSCRELFGTWLLSFRALRRRTFVLLAEDPEDPTYWSKETIKRYVNDAYIAICRDTKVLEFIEEITAGANTAEYGLTDNLLQIKRVFVNGVGIANRTKLELDRSEPGWGSYAQDANWYITTQHDNRRISVDPVPSAGDEIDVWAVMLPDWMTGECETMDIPAWAHPAIPFMAAARALNTYGEHGNREMSVAYSAIAADYLSLLRGFVQHRIGEK